MMATGVWLQKWVNTHRPPCHGRNKHMNSLLDKTVTTVQRVNF